MTDETALTTNFPAIWSKMSRSSSSSSPSSTVVLVLILGVLFQMTIVADAISCLICDSIVDGASCVYHPPRGTPCPFDNCITALEYRRGALHSAKMACSPVAVEATCVEGKDQRSNEDFELCYWTCSSNDCNRPRHRSLHHILELLSRRRRRRRRR